MPCKVIAYEDSLEQIITLLKPSGILSDFSLGADTIWFLIGPHIKDLAPRVSLLEYDETLLEMGKSRKYLGLLE